MDHQQKHALVPLSEPGGAALHYLILTCPIFFSNQSQHVMGSSLVALD